LKNRKLTVIQLSKLIDAPKFDSWQFIDRNLYKCIES